MTVTRRRNRLPEYDGQYLHLENLLGEHGPQNLQEAWLSCTWDGTWWCTSCWAQKQFDYVLPITDTDQYTIRCKMGILSDVQLAKASYGKRRWGADSPFGVVAEVADF